VPDLTPGPRQELTEMSDPRASEQGFSLIELMVAMVITLIVSGAIFGLMVGGESAFRRNPELTDRQQSIRVAMDMIQRDIATAGMGLGAFTQTFTDGLDSAGTLPSAIESAGNTDILEIRGNDGMCPEVPLGSMEGANMVATANFPDCYDEDTMVMLVFPPESQIGARFGLAHQIHSANRKWNIPGGLAGGVQIQKCPANLGYTPEDETCNQPSEPRGVVKMQMFRYEIAPDTDGLPSLWRSTTGGFDNATAAVQPVGPGQSAWSLVARGVEDLQVWYTALQVPPPGPPGPPGFPVAPAATAQAGWASTPGTAIPGDYSTLILQVRVALSARTETANLQGARQSPNAAVEAAPRGWLVSTTTARSSLFYLTQLPPLPDPTPAGYVDPYAAYRWQ
jgi:prepilin-type N-terminal cleavage/methylation domain-containing protein